MDSMWQYWREKYYTPMAAIRRQYPGMLKQHPELLAMVIIAENASQAVDSYMTKLSEEVE